MICATATRNRVCVRNYRIVKEQTVRATPLPRRLALPSGKPRDRRTVVAPAGRWPGGGAAIRLGPAPHPVARGAFVSLLYAAHLSRVRVFEEFLEDVFPGKNGA